MEFWRLAKVRWTALLGGALLLRLLFFVGPQASDDLVYSDYAHAMVTGGFHLSSDIFSTRLGYLASIAAIYAVFGAGAFTLVLTNLVFSLAGLVLAYHIAREFLDEAGAWRTAFLLALFPLDLFFATEAHTDLPLAVLLSGAVYLFLKARKQDKLPLYFAAGAVLGIAHLFKESAFFGLAAFLALGGKPKLREAGMQAGFLGVAALEAIGYALATGDPLYRVHAVHDAQIRNLDALQSPGSAFGLVVGSLTQFVNPFSANFPFFGLLPLLAMAGTVCALKAKEPTLRPVMFWAAALIGLLVFWPLTLIPYRPALWTHARIFLMAEVPMAILAASLLGRVSGLRGRLAISVFVVTSITCTALIHSDARRMTEGARWAFDGPLHSEGVAISDPRTTSLFRIYDGYTSSRSWLDWNAPVPSTRPKRVVNGTWVRTLKDWYGIEPPSGFEPAGEKPGSVHTIPGRIRLKSLLRGRVERQNPDEVRIY